MRPKKVILYVDANEQNVSILAFALKTNGYRVLRATSFGEALKTFIENPVDLVAINFALPGPAGHEDAGDELIVALKEHAAHIPMVLLADPEKLRDHHADSVLFIKTGPMIEVLERFKVMLVRKRGPRKGSASWPRKPKCEPPELVAQGAA